MATSTRSFRWSRLGSLLSVLPLGVWTINHLWDNLAVFGGPDAWQKAVTGHAHPASLIATMVVVLLPLVLHTLWGVQRLFSFRPNNQRYPFFVNLRYLLQRLAAIGALFFIGAHLWLAMIKPRFFEGRPEPFEDIAREMRFHGPTLVVYLLGTLAVCFHLANGLATFAFNWGVISGGRSIQRSQWAAIALFVLFLAMAWGAVFGLFRAGDVLGPAH